MMALGDSQDKVSALDSRSTGTTSVMETPSPAAKDKSRHRCIGKKAAGASSPTAKTAVDGCLFSADEQQKDQTFDLPITPEPVAKRRRTGPRDKAAQELGAEATRLEAVARALELQASKAKNDAQEARKSAQAMAQEAAELIAAACKAKTTAEEAARRAERAQLEKTPEGRAAAKEQDKLDKKAAAAHTRDAKSAAKEEAAATRSTIKDIGDAIKDSMVISKSRGMWSVPPGNLSFRNITFGVFKELFGRGRCAFTPVNNCESDPTISLVTKDAASIFGSTKVRGGSMYATFVISSLRATYIPAQQRLAIAYQTDDGF